MCYCGLHPDDHDCDYWERLETETILARLADIEHERREAISTDLDTPITTE